MQQKEYNFFSSFNHSESNFVLKDLLNRAANDLLPKLEKLEIEKLNVSEYTKNYFNNYKSKFYYSLECGCYILYNALEHFKGNMERAVLAEHGAGIGMIALLAKSAGIGKVIHNEIYNVSSTDAAIIAEHLHLKADEYVCGDLKELIHFLNSNHIKLDGFISRNVLEHIYDLQAFFEELKWIPSKELGICMATTANIKNPLVNLYTQKLQRMAEYEYGSFKKQNPDFVPFSLVRKQIIEDNYPQGNAKEKLQLVIASRGLVKKDILKLIEKYKQTNVLPPKPEHPTNTCDPNTGNRTENLVKHEYYLEQMQKNGFQTELKPGFYNTRYKSNLLNYFTPFINGLIRYEGKLAMFLAPFIAIKAKITNT